MWLNVYTDSVSLYCGVDVVFLKVENKTLAISSSYGEIDLRVVSKGSRGSRRAVDHNGNYYIVSAMGDDNGGIGIAFVPEDRNRFTFFVSNKSTCED
jgi:hypothetical protein